MPMLAVLLALLYLALGGIACSTGSDRGAVPGPHQEGTPGMDTPPLLLLARAEGGTFRTGSPIPVEVTLRNVSSRPIWVNARLGVGYEDGLSRELFFTVIDASSGRVLPVPDTARVDVHRMPPARTDFRELAPGEAVGATVDLAFWYPFQRPGDYRVVVTYENDDDGRRFGLDAFTGAVAADPLELAVV
jgi:hypothetical protein